MLRIVNVRAVTESVAVLVCSFRLFVIKRDGINTKLRQRVQLGWFRDSVVIRVLPQSQRIEDRITLIDYSVAISAVCRLVVFGKSIESVETNAGRWWWLLRERTEQFRAIVNRAVAIAIEHQP